VHTEPQRRSARGVLTSQLRGPANPTGQGELAVLAPRRCAWPPCSRWFTPKPGGTNAHYCDRECKKLAKAQRLSERRDSVGTAQARVHPLLVAVEAAEADLARGVPLEQVLGALRRCHAPAFIDLLSWALSERASLKSSCARS
jgi:hypothetical protein